MSPSGTPESSSAACTQLLRQRRWPSPLSDGLGTLKCPAIRFRRESRFEAFRFAHLLRPADLFASLADPTRLLPRVDTHCPLSSWVRAPLHRPSRQRLLLPSFRRVGFPSRRRVWLRWQLGNFHRRVLHPLERQLASLRRTRRFPPSGSSVEVTRGYDPQIRTVIRGRGRGNRTSKAVNLSEVRRVPWLRRRSHLSHAFFVSSTRSCRLRKLPLTPK